MNTVFKNGDDYEVRSGRLTLVFTITETKLSDEVWYCVFSQLLVESSDMLIGKKKKQLSQMQQVFLPP